MRKVVLLVALLGSNAAPVVASALTANDCRGLEPSVAIAATTMRQNMNAYADLALSLVGLMQLAEGRPGVRQAAQEVIVGAPRSLEAQRAAMAAIEDLQHQLRLCGREPEAAPAAPGR